MVNEKFKQEVTVAFEKYGLKAYVEEEEIFLHNGIVITTGLRIQNKRTLSPLYVSESEGLPEYTAAHMVADLVKELRRNANELERILEGD